MARAGSDIAALAEGDGPVDFAQSAPALADPAEERLQLMATQLHGIGGSRSIGFGAERVLSLPDAVCQALNWHIEQGLSNVPRPLNKAGISSNGNGHQNGTPAVKQLTLPTVLGNICPSCGSSAAFVLEEGCKKCHGCGYSEC